MATEGYVKFEYFSKGVPPYYNSRSFPELLDDESIVISTPCLEMSYHQYFALFKKFLMAVGFDEKNIMQGACNLAFNEMNNEKTMREVAEEYDLVMNEDLPALMEDRLKQEKEWLEQNKPEPDIWEKRYWAVYRKLRDIELQKNTDDPVPPQNHSVMEALKYTDEELDAMCDAAELKKWNGLIPGSDEAREKGCICPVLDNEEMPDDKKWIDVECSIHGRKKHD